MPTEISRMTRVLALTILSVPAVAQTQAANIPDQILLDSLRWYFNWVKPIPATGGSIDCRGLEFTTAYFTYCEPGKVVLDVHKGDGLRNRPKVQLIFTTTDEYTEALDNFLRDNGENAGGRSYRIALGLQDIAHYEPDPSLSATWMNATRPFMETYLRTLKGYGGAAPKALFPLVAKGDPFYQVYVVQDAEVESVWEFAVTNRIIQGDHQKWVYDRPHRNIPTKAERNASEAQRWYATVVAPQD